MSSKRKKKVLSILKAEIIKEIAHEDGGTPAEIAEIVESQFEFLSDIVRHGAFEGVRLPHFGTFWAKPQRVQLVNQEAINKRLKKDGLIQTGKPFTGNKRRNTGNSGDQETDRQG